VSGLRVSEGSGESFEEVVRPEVAARILPLWRRCLETGEPVHYLDDYVRRTDGARFVLQATAVPVRGSGGAVRRLLVVSRDITDQRQAEEAVRALNQDLERRVAERTAQLRGANNELEAFAYSVSHDLRAPLRHVGGFLELLRRQLGDTLDDQARHNFENIAGAALHMGKLVDDLLAFARMGRRELARAPVDLADVVREAIAELGPEQRGRAVRWEVGPLRVVMADPALLRLAMVNLLSNALKFTRPCAAAVIEVGRVAQEDLASPEEVVFVRDNGVGFDMAHAGKLFGVFQRLHRAEEFEGTGIGLASVRRIVARHGGRTWAEGRPDAGATFYLALPRTPGAATGSG